MDDEETVFEISLGQKIVGKGLLFFVAVILICVGVGYVSSTLLILEWLYVHEKDSDSLAMLVLVVISTVILHVFGKVMSQFTDYILGQTRHMDGEIWLRKCGWQILRDVSFPMTCLFLFTAFAAFMFTHYISALGASFLGAIFSFLSWRSSKALRKKKSA